MGATRRHLLLFAGAALAVLLAAEGVARVLEPALPEPERWPDATTAVKVAQMDALGCTDLVLVGNSMARDAFDPELVGEATGVDAYNASLDAASPAQLARWLPDEVIPRLDPTTVVWAVSSPDLNDEAPAGRAAFEAYDTSIGGREDVLGRAQDELAQRSVLVAQRDALRDPPTLWTAVGDRLAGDEVPRTDGSGIPGLIGPRGQGLSRRELTYRPDDPVATRIVTDQLLTDFDLGGAQQRHADELVHALTRRGIEVVLVQLPVTEEFIALHPDGADDWDDYRAAMRTLAADTGTRLVDLTDGFDADGAFADTHHLNAAGSTRVSAHLAAELGALPHVCGESS
jgi:hypothetical protein